MNIIRNFKNCKIEHKPSIDLFWIKSSIEVKIQNKYLIVKQTVHMKVFKIMLYANEPKCFVYYKHFVNPKRLEYSSTFLNILRYTMYYNFLS